MLKIAFHPNYVLPLPEGHRFPMEKYALLPEQLKYEGLVSDANFFTPEKVPLHAVLAVHQTDYVEKLLHLRLDKQEQRRAGFPLSQALVERELTIVQGTITSTFFAKQYGVALNIAGGTHHAFPDHAEGFCLLNDQAIAAQYLLDHKLAKRILIIDLDVHHGNGTAHIFTQNPQVFTFSMHGANNYPAQKPPSDLDIALADQTGDDTYLQLLKHHLPQIIAQFQPDFAFFQSGVDVLGTDKLGRLALTMQGCYQRDEFVFQLCKQKQLPLAVAMGGGYASRISDIVCAHANTFRLAQKIFF